MRLSSERDGIDWMWAAKALAVVSAWNELGLFQRMHREPIPLAALELEPRALATTLPVLLHVGLVVSDGQSLSLTSQGKKLLEEHALPSGRNLEWLRDLGKMAEVLRIGGPVRDEQGRSKGTTGGTRADDPEQTEKFLDMLYRSSEAAARAVYDCLSRDLPRGGRVLDLGGGHGRYGRAFADAGFSVTLFDLPHVIRISRKRHGDALEYVEGDFHQAESFGGPYDLVLLSNIVHSEPPAANATLIARLTASLRPQGRVAVKDMFLDELGRDPENAVFFGVTMLLYTEAGRSPSHREASEWFVGAGLGTPRTILLENQALLVGQRT